MRTALEIEVKELVRRLYVHNVCQVVSACGNGGMDEWWMLSLSIMYNTIALYRPQNEILVLIFFSLQKCFDGEGKDRKDEVGDVRFSWVRRQMLGKEKKKKNQPLWMWVWTILLPRVNAKMWKGLRNNTLKC